MLCSSPLPSLYLFGVIFTSLYSAKILFTLIDFNPPNFKKVFLLGNHEQMLLEFISESRNSPFVWIYNGGSETLESYGMDLSNNIDDTMDLTIDKKFIFKSSSNVLSFRLLKGLRLILNILFGVVLLGASF